MELLILKLTLTCGLMLDDQFYLYNQYGHNYVVNYSISKNLVMSYIEPDMEFTLAKIFYFGGSINTYIYPLGYGVGFGLTNMYYIFRAGLRFDNFEIGYQHGCYHPIYAYERANLSNDLQRSTTEGAYNEVYIKFKGEIKIF
jgi:hypothetical protein